jgi:hypothetical protein
VLAASVVVANADAQTASPGPRAGGFMVYDEARAQTVLFGGWTRAAAGGDIGYPDDLWAWNGDRWTKLEPSSDSPRPRGRDAPVLAYDAARKRVVMFGGRGDATGQSASWLSDVWEWDGARWYRLLASGMPRLLHPMTTYDPVRRRVVVYGGGLVTETGAFGGLSRTLWEWDGAHWSPRDTAGLANHIPGAMAAGRAGVVVLAGEANVNQHSAAAPSPTMRFSESSWSRTPDGPAFNNLQATTGTPDGTIYFYHAWEEWLTQPLLHVRDPNGAWRRVETSPNPGVRNTQAMAWDSRRQRLVLFGGSTRDQRLLDDTWEFDGRTWVKR